MSEQPEALRLAELCDTGAKVELLRRDNLIDSLHGLCESYRTQVESLEADPRIGKCQACGHECEACHSKNASQTPQTGLSLVAAPQEWSPAYTRGQARQSAPVAAVPALVPLTDEQWLEYLLKYADASILDIAAYHGESIQDRGLWRLRGYANSLRKLVESAHGIGPTVGDGGQG